MTAIVIYSVAIQAVVTGKFSTWDAAGKFAVSALVGVGVGLLFGWAVIGGAAVVIGVVVGLRLI
ncbi:hypothetical protein [Nocardia sp. SYP-A9097]|uniref:hypothetical protein n=1 Tax=Nocardia sp. SYP-A9097 TaxID=2663237 RepID=UPI001E5BD539|nr:hypothetical protein [Nocardia sp. SYP-A9097]